MSIEPTEFTEKISRMRTLLESHGAGALLLRRISSFAWATCGAESYVNLAASEGAASLLITPERHFLFTNNIEAPRLEKEGNLDGQGWEFVVSPWDDPNRWIASHLHGLNLLADVPFPGARDVSGEIASLRCRLNTVEGQRFRELGRMCAQVMTAAAGRIEPGMREHQVAAWLDLEARTLGIQPIVNLVASDERAYAYRHPLPTDKPLERYVMLVLCGRRQGLVCSLSRLVHWGKAPEELQRRLAATAQVNAALIAHSRPGRSLGEVLAQGVQAYAAAGYPDAWRQHHQGGITGYEPREKLATPESADVLFEGQALAWNPSIAGVKTEDTILVGSESNEIITATPVWTRIDVQIDGVAVKIASAGIMQL